MYKAPAGVAADPTFVLESLGQLGNSLNKFLPGAEDDLTAGELIYSEAVGILSTLIPHTAGSDRSATAVETTVQLVDAVQAAIDTLLARIQSTGEDIQHTISKLTSFHDLTMLHDTATAATLATGWILAFNEREKTRDRSGNSNLPKDVVAHVKTLQTSAEVALKAGKAWVAALKDEVAKADFERKVKRWAFEGDKALGELVEDGTVGEVVASWKMVVKGWGDVRWV